MGEERLQVEGRWPPEYEGRSINSLELEAVLFALEKWSTALSGQVLMVLSDNTSTVSYLKKQGDTHSLFLA